jgi:hypothetical protein
MSMCDEYAPVVNKIAQAAIAGLLEKNSSAGYLFPITRPTSDQHRIQA